MAEASRNSLHVRASSDGERCAGVSQVLELEPRQTSRLNSRLPDTCREMRAPDGLTGVTAEDESVRCRRIALNVLNRNKKPQTRVASRGSRVSLRRGAAAVLGCPCLRGRGGCGQAVPASPQRCAPALVCERHKAKVWRSSMRSPPHTLRSAVDPSIYDTLRGRTASCDWSTACLRLAKRMEPVAICRGSLMLSATRKDANTQLWQPAPTDADVCFSGTWKPKV
jgi:hypothetical protein